MRVRSGPRADVPAPVSAPTRRCFLIGSGLLLTFGPGVDGRAAATPESDATLAGLVRIAPDGSVSLVVPNIEMGQGIYTTEAMMIAEELEIDPCSVTVLTALPQDVTALSPAFLRSLSTGGSRSVRKAWLPLRQAGARARMMLMQAAAERWRVPVSTVIAESGRIRDRTGRLSLSYGALATDAARQPVPEHVSLKPRAAWTLIGNPVPRIDIPAKVNGQAVYGIDVHLPGMAVAAVQGPPHWGATIGNLDARQARGMPGVLDVVRIEDHVAVVARNYWTARKGLDALGITWTDGRDARLSSTEIREIMRARAMTGTPVVARNDPGADQADGTIIESTYDLPFLAHAAMEPLSVTMRIGADKCDVWMGTQVPTRARAIVSRITGLPERRVAIHNHMIGGSFGRRLATDFLEHATKLARQVSRPVKFIWSREEDFRQDVFRPAYHDTIRASIGPDGLPSGWTHRVVGPSVVDRFAPGGLPDGSLDADAVAGAVDIPYDVPRRRVAWTRVSLPVPVGWWRGVGPAHNVYVVESFIDELSFAARIDPIAYRLRLLGKNPRAAAVLRRVARESHWEAAAADGVGRGVALHDAFGSYCAVVTEILARPGNAFVIKKVTAVIDCGIAIDRDSVIAQMEGGLLFGFSAALYGDVTFRKGQVEKTNFDRYRLMRIAETPSIDVIVIESDEDPGGIGEVGTTAAFPALGNAIFSATGVRHRTYPLLSPPDG